MIKIYNFYLLIMLAVFTSYSLSAEMLFSLNFDDGYLAKAKNEDSAFVVKGKGIGIIEKAGCPIAPESSALDQQNVSISTKRICGSLSYPTTNINANRGAFSLWVKVYEGDAIYKTFLEAGNVLWDKSYSISLYYDVPGKKLCFCYNYKRDKGEYCSVFSKVEFNPEKWYHIIASWTWDKDLSKMIVVLAVKSQDGEKWLISENEHSVDKIINTEIFSISNCGLRVWIGSSKGGLNPGSCLMDEINIYDEYIPKDKIEEFADKINRQSK